MIRGTNALLVLSALAVGVAKADSAPLWGPHVDIEAKPGSKRTLGEIDLFLPLSQDARTLVFGNLRARLDNKSSYEGNFGAGVRRMHDNGWNLGAYGYWDHRRSPNGNFFDQATLGVEALGRDFDFRANGYVPVGTKAYALSPESTAAVSGASVQVTTAFREERALKGFDMEAGWRLPIFDSEAARQLRLYVGGYRFADAGVKVEGPRLRAELALHELPWLGKGAGLLLGAEMQDDNARGGQSFLSVRLRIPLGEERASARILTAQERRMTAPVMRDVDIVTQDRVASTLVETATTTGGQTITALYSATTSGAALQAALNAAGANSTVILSGSFDTGNDTTITLSSGQTLMGRGTLTVRSPSGRTATLVASTGATITSTSATALGQLTAIDMAVNSTLTGMTLTPTTAAVNASVYAVRVNGVAGTTISNNTITATSPNSTVMGVRIQGASDVTVSGNTITTTNSNAGGMAVGLYMGGTSVSLTNNTFSVSADNKYAVYRNAGTITASGNTYVTSAGCSNGGAGMACP